MISSTPNATNHFQLIIENGIRTTPALDSSFLNLDSVQLGVLLENACPKMGLCATESF
jgi:hypothetical protein